VVQPSYRSDVDGLRALAVLCVVAFHAFPQQFPGGFVGVDIFFVISGFLISTIIYQSLQRDAFSFIEFYARRARRIFPALIVVLLACAMAGWLLMLQSELRALGKNIAAAAAFIANYAYFQESGYFDQAAELKTLLHLWSLGVEEQYYLVWPLLVVLSSRYRNGPLAVAAIVFAGSFASNVMLVRTDAAAAFYLPLPRFWELMLGSGLALILARKRETLAGINGPDVAIELVPSRAGMAAEASAWIGSGLIVCALLLIDGNRLFPGFWALLPTVGAVLLIAAGQQTTVNRLFSQRWLVHVGLISYPLYLWHWPILAFERLLRPKDPTDLMRFGGVVAAFILADLTYRWIEKPIRSGRAVMPRAIATAAALVVCGCLGLVFYFGDGFPRRLPPEVQTLGQELALADSKVGQFSDNECFRISDSNFPPKCDGGDNTAPLVLLWGDSHAVHLDHGLRNVQQSRGDFRLAEYTKPACPPVTSLDTDRQDCRSGNELAMRKMRELQPDTVIIAARWGAYDGHPLAVVTEAMIRETVTQVVATGTRRVVVIGQFPGWEAAVPRIRIWRSRLSITADKSDAANLDRAFPQQLSRDIDANNMVQRALVGTGAIFVSPLATLCNHEGCLLAVPGTSHSIALDHDHLAASASDFFVGANVQALLGH